MKAWLSENNISYVDRDILTNPPPADLVVQLSATLPEGVMKFVHPEKSIDGQPAREKLRGQDAQAIAERLVKEPDLFLKPVLTDGSQVLLGKDRERFDQLLPTLQKA